MTHPPLRFSAASDALPVRRGAHGAIAAAHPLAVAAGEEVLRAGGSAADAVIAAQAALCVIMPDACGLGGDMLALLHRAGRAPLAFNGTGAAPAALERVSDDGANSITVPGIVDAWCRLSAEAGRLPLGRVLRPAIGLARTGVPVSATLARALATQRARLVRGGAEAWVLFDLRAGSVRPQPALEATLTLIGEQGREAFYAGASARAIARRVLTLRGALTEADLAGHATVVAAPVESDWNGWRISTQPPMTQGVLLNLALAGLRSLGDLPAALDDHAAIEATGAAFAFRNDVGEGAALLGRELAIDLTRASGRAGPRAYLHTAGVAAVDADGCIVSSLVSVFDDFGSCVFIPELGIVLNNRAAGFTSGANAAAPGKRPVHTLAPMLLTTPQGVLALATPGADGQVQTLLQVLVALARGEVSVAGAIARPRWRSENGRLLIEADHGGIAALAALGHQTVTLPRGDTRFGAVVCAGDLDGELVAAADWRRETASGAV